MAATSTPSSPTCPRPEQIFDIMREKSKLAKKVVVRQDRKILIDIAPIFRRAAKVFGELQDVLESKPPPSAAYRAVIESIPGLIACYHRYLYEKSGLLKNEIIALEGGGGIGKTSYVYWLVKMVGGVIINDPYTLVDVVEEALAHGKWYPIMVLDDIAAIVSKYWYMIRGERVWVHFFKIIEYAKDWTGLIIITARSFDGIARRFRELSTLHGHYIRAVIKGHMVDYILWYPTGRRLPKFVDILWPGLRVEPETWMELTMKRRKLALRELTRLKEALGEEMEEKEEEGENE